MVLRTARCIATIGLLAVWIAAVPRSAWAAEESSTTAPVEQPGTPSATDGGLDAAAEQFLGGAAAQDTAAYAPATEPSLTLNGFADFRYTLPLMKYDNPWYFNFSRYDAFQVGHINLYLNSVLSERWSSLAEVRFLYLPLGGSQIAGTGNIVRTNTALYDPAEFGAIVRWGGISVQRAFVEYRVHPNVSVRAGQFITPVGIWVVDHGSPTIVAVRPPYIIAQALFPLIQTGLEVYGTYDFGVLEVGYHLTLSNGRGPYDFYMDLDHNKGVGGRLFLHTRELGDLRIGISAYKGKFTDRADRYTVQQTDGQSVLQVASQITQQYNELALQFDARWELGELLVQGELAINETAYTAAGRPTVQQLDGTPAWASDSRQWGVYALAGYRTPLWGIMPFVMGEYYTFGAANVGATEVGLTGACAVTGGLNIRPEPYVVLKIQAGISWFPGNNPEWAKENNASIFESEVAWAF